MTKHIVKVLKTEMLLPNFKRFVVEKPSGYSFVSGQATDVSINKPRLEEELRPFTFTSLKQDESLEFMIKIYTGHNGLTEKLLEVNEGDELIVHDVFGTISYHGPGLFIAGGAGITPFISIFRMLKADHKSEGNSLLFANRTNTDIILKEELKNMLGEQHYFDVIEVSETSPEVKTFITKDLLKKHLVHSHYYVCGPDKFTALMLEYLEALGIKKSNIIYEQ